MKCISTGDYYYESNYKSFQDLWNSEEEFYLSEYKDIYNVQRHKDNPPPSSQLPMSA